MLTANMLDAKSNLSRLVESIEQREEREIIIARIGRAVAKLVAIDACEWQDWWMRAARQGQAATFVSPP